MKDKVVEEDEEDDDEKDENHDEYDVDDDDTEDETYGSRKRKNRSTGSSEIIAKKPKRCPHTSNVQDVVPCNISDCICLGKGEILKCNDCDAYCHKCNKCDKVHKFGYQNNALDKAKLASCLQQRNPIVPSHCCITMKQHSCVLGDKYSLLGVFEIEYHVH